MFELSQDIRVEWRHCDPAQIVYNPHYFDWADQATFRLFEEAGYNVARMMLDDRSFKGTPLLKTEALFKAPANCGDTLLVTSHVCRWGGRSFDVEHKFCHDEAVVADIRETRVWGRADEKDPHKLVACFVPEEVKAALTAPVKRHLAPTGG